VSGAVAPLLLLAAEDRLLVVRSEGSIDEQLSGKDVTCLAVASGSASRAYAGTDREGLWGSDDHGRSWRHLAGFEGREITAVAADPGGSVVYVGTEPSAFYRSTDGGETWEESTELNRLPSASEWSFPPRPETHHVRWIEPDPTVPGRLFVAIEAGALIRSPDGGRTWQDRVRGGPYDTHTLAAHRRAPGRLYSAAGDGYFESPDGGETWTRPRRGLGHGYLVWVAVHPLDPDVILVSASPGPWTAYNARGAESYVYRKDHNRPWTVVRAGLPEAKGMTVSALAPSTAEPGVVYAANNLGIFHSADFGATWQRVEVPWPRALRSQHIRSLALIENPP
jgi:photosystem II stability/assembly factor-like uncharacterized protein